MQLHAAARASRTAPHAPHAHPHPSARAARPVPTIGRLAIGYLALEDRGDNRAERAAALEQWCRRRGWALAGVSHDVVPRHGRLHDRPGLQHALQSIADGHARALVVARLDHLTRAAADLAPLLRWCARNRAALVALDLGLDTSTEPGRAAARALVEVSGWEQARISSQTERGLAAIRAHHHERRADRDNAVKDRIAAMRADGMTLQAIADALNADQVPTLRGGTHWRASSVHGALGYRRPGNRELRLP